MKAENRSLENGFLCLRPCGAHLEVRFFSSRAPYVPSHGKPKQRGTCNYYTIYPCEMVHFEPLSANSSRHRPIFNNFFSKKL